MGTVGFAFFAFPLVISPWDLVTCTRMKDVWEEEEEEEVVVCREIIDFPCAALTDCVSYMRAFINQLHVIVASMVGCEEIGRGIVKCVHWSRYKILREKYGDFLSFLFLNFHHIHCRKSCNWHVPNGWCLRNMMIEIYLSITQSFGVSKWTGKRNGWKRATNWF